MTRDAQHVCQTVAPAPDTGDSMNVSLDRHSRPPFLLLASPHVPWTLISLSWLCLSSSPTCSGTLLNLLHVRESQTYLHECFTEDGNTTGLFLPRPPISDRHGLCVSDPRSIHGRRTPAFQCAVCFTYCKQKVL